MLDVDDTLYLERDYVRSGLESVAGWAKVRLGVPDLFTHVWAAFEAGHRGDLFDRGLRSYGLEPTDEVIMEMVGRYRSHVPTIALAPDARRFLADASADWKVAVVTDGPVESQRAKVEALGLWSWADPVVLTGALGAEYHKPSPRAFELVQERLMAEPEACCYVADNPAKDFQGPKSIGWYAVRVRRPGGLHADTPSASDVDFELPSMDSLARVLRTI